MKRILTAIAAVMLVSMSGLAGSWQTREGYRGFVDAGGIAGLGDWGMDAFTLSTTHGYQVVPSYLYVGAGIGVHVGDGACFMPLYADFRTQLPTGRFSPFFDMRIGYSGRVDDCRFDCGGAYLNPSIGVTWTLSRRVGMELAVGYTYQDAVILDIEMGGMPIAQVRKNIGGLNIRLGVTF